MLQRSPLSTEDMMQPALAHQPVMVPATLVEPLAEPGMAAMLLDTLAAQVCRPAVHTLLFKHEAPRLPVCELPDSAARLLQERRAAIRA